MAHTEWRKAGFLRGTGAGFRIMVSFETASQNHQFPPFLLLPKLDAAVEDADGSCLHWALGCGAPDAGEDE